MISFDAFTDELVKISGLLQREAGKDVLNAIGKLGPVGRAAVSGVLLGGVLGASSVAGQDLMTFDPNFGPRPATDLEKGWRTAKAGLKGGLVGGLGGMIMGATLGRK